MLRLIYSLICSVFIGLTPCYLLRKMYVLDEASIEIIFIISAIVLLIIFHVFIFKELPSLVSRFKVNEKYYVQAEQEVDEGKIDRDKWAKILVYTKGNEEKRKAEYIKMRAKQIQKEIGNRNQRTNKLERGDSQLDALDDDAESSSVSDTAHFLVLDEKTGKVHSEFRYRGSNDFDAFPQGYGDFGTSKTNPIPTCGITGSAEYLARLRTADGEEILAKRLGSIWSDNIKEIIDKYEVFKKSSQKKLGELYLCSFSKQTSSRSPEGFTLILR